MRKSIHTDDLHIKLSQKLVQDVRVVAERRGMTLSELTRHALRRELHEAA